MVTNGKYKITTEHRITTLEGNYRELKADIIELRDNHIAHLSKEVASVKKIMWSVAVGIIAVLIELTLRMWIS